MSLLMCTYESFITAHYTHASRPYESDLILHKRNSVIYPRYMNQASAHWTHALGACTVVFPNFFREFLASVVLVVFLMGGVFEILHVRPVTQ